MLDSTTTLVMMPLLCSYSILMLHNYINYTATFGAALNPHSFRRVCCSSHGSEAWRPLGRRLKEEGHTTLTQAWIASRSQSSNFSRRIYSLVHVAHWNLCPVFGDFCEVLKQRSDLFPEINLKRRHEEPSIGDGTKPQEEPLNVL